jgi:hypothetical protein
MSLKRWLLVFLVTCLVAAGSFFLLRNRILGYFIGNLGNRLEQTYNIRMETAGFGFEGITGIRISGVTLFAKGNDTLAVLEQARFRISLSRYFRGQPPADRFIMQDLLIHLDAWPTQVKEAAGNKTANNDSIPENRQLNYDMLVKRAWTRFLDLADFDFRIDHMTVRWRSDGSAEQLSSNLVLLDRSRFTADITDTRNGTQYSWWIDGVIDHKSGMAVLAGSTNSEHAAPLPFVERLTGFSCAMKSFKIGCIGSDETGSGYRLNLSGTAVAPSLQHWRISELPVSLDSVAAGMNLHFSGPEVIADSGSGIRLNSLPVFTRLLYRDGDSARMSMKLQIPKIAAQEFFKSLPQGLFATLKGIRVNGDFSYQLDFDVNPDDPDSLYFKSEIMAKGLGIQQFGSERFSRINESFAYSPVENDQVVRTFMVGPENPYFTPLDQIPTILTGAVLIAEDGTYWNHRGFNEESFRQSIATNIREKRFARGGSTITMQLVKNVYLSRDKTISRKLEEAIIVWLIENTDMVSKERMLEVYLNIIEWGPGVYGIGEASHYYFNKKPADLTLSECIYLSAIIPRPKSFRYTFDAQGMLRPYLKNYFNLVAGRMVRKEIIPAADTVNMPYQVYLTGRARELVIPTDSLPPDSLQPEVPELLFDN